MKQAYLVSHYGYHTCSECGVRYTEKEYWEYYCLDKIMRCHINCKKCGAEFHEKPQRCYWSDHYPDQSNACGEAVTMDGVVYCTQQLKARKEELRSWGAYYPCPCYKPKPPQEDYFSAIILLGGQAHVRYKVSNYLKDKPRRCDSAKIRGRVLFRSQPHLWRTA